MSSLLAAVIFVLGGFLVASGIASGDLLHLALGSICVIGVFFELMRDVGESDE